jgi:hypothetical protein
MHLHRHLGWLLLLVLLPLLPLGCGKKASKGVPVSGRVLMDKKPLANAFVTFSPAETQPGTLPAEASGRTDEQGHYSLKLNKDNSDGALPGNYRVRISIFDRGSDKSPGRGQLVPEQFNRNTKLNFTVPPQGTPEANFDITSR